MSRITKLNVFFMSKVLKFIHEKQSKYKIVLILKLANIVRPISIDKISLVTNKLSEGNVTRQQPLQKKKIKMNVNTNEQTKKTRALKIPKGRFDRVFKNLFSIKMSYLSTESRSKILFLMK